MQQDAEADLPQNVANMGKYTDFSCIFALFYDLRALQNINIMTIKHRPSVSEEYNLIRPFSQFFHLFVPYFYLCYRV
jgi:hypothetical protein